MENKNTENQKGKDIDEGKVKALYEAGWQITNIARDFGTDEERIRETLRKLQEERSSAR